MAQMQDCAQIHAHPRPGSTAAQEPAAPPLPPRTYGAAAAAPGYQSPAPSAGPGPPPPPHGAGGYHPGAYGVIGQAASATQASCPAPRHEELPPPPPPKPHGFAAAVQRQQEYHWQQQEYQRQQQQQYHHHQQHQQAPGFTPQLQQVGYATPATPQQYNHAAPPPPSATPGGSYLPPAQVGRPGSMYGASQVGAHVTPRPTGLQHTYIPPSMNPSFQTQGYQDALSRHSQQIPQSQSPYTMPASQSYGQQVQAQYVPQALPQTQPLQHNQHNQHSHYTQPQRQSYGQPLQSPDQVQQQAPPQPPYGQAQQGYSTQHAYGPGHQTQWQASPQIEQGGLPPRNEPWQPDHQAQAPLPVQQHGAFEQGAMMSNATGCIDATSSQSYSQPSPQSQPVSPIGVSLGSRQQSGHGRSENMQSSISSDKQAKNPSDDIASPVPHPLREDKSRFSALGAGGPSDWERFGGDGDEIDDEEAFGSKKEQKKTVTAPLDSVELPAHVPSPPPTHAWPSPAQSSHSYSRDRRGTYAPSPPPANEPSLKITNIELPSLSTVLGGAMTNSEWAASQQTPTQAPAVWSLQANERHNAELWAKDEALEHLRVDAEKERASLGAEIEKLKVDVETVKSHAASELANLHAELKMFKAASEKVAAEYAAVEREKEATIDRMKEDAEGKERNIDERDDIIMNLKRQMEVEKSKEVTKPTPSDLILGIDPWYIGSLERYIAMLRSEANEPQVEEKIKIFRAFCKAESEIRGIDYYDAPPPPPLSMPQVLQHPEQPAATLNLSARTQDLSICVPQQPLPEDDDDYDFSPGGRPILKRGPTLPAAERASTQPQINASSQSTTVLTPTSSVEGDTNKTPVQSPPEEISQPQYKAYVPATNVPERVSISHRTASSFSSISGLSSPSGHSKGPDEIFFAAHNPSISKTNSRPTSSSSPVAIPAPLKLASSRPVSNAARSRQTPSDALCKLLPDATLPSTTSHCIDEARVRFDAIKLNANNAEESTKSWEKSASLDRRKRDDARRKRQEENEEHNDELFNNEEISYAEMNQREEEFKQEECRVKAQEDGEEYQSYVEAVFDPVYETLQVDIKTLTELSVEVESVLPTSVCGVQCMQSGDAPGTKDCLELLQGIHELVEKRHAAVVEAVADRDRRYKKTELQPLYAAGNMARMKEVEKHFEHAEKQAVVRAKRDKAERVAEFVKLSEEVVIDAVSTEQSEINGIMTAIKDFEDGQGDAELLMRALDALVLLKASSKALLSLFNSLEILLNDSVLDAKIAQVKLEGGAAGRLQELEREKWAGAAKMTAEYERRIAVLEQDDHEMEQLVRRKGGWMGRGEELAGGGKEERFKAALEEAKRRNGAV